MLSKLTDDILPKRSVFVGSKHLVKIRRHEPFKGLPNKYKLEVVFVRKTCELRGVLKRSHIEVVVVFAEMDTVAVGRS